MVLTQAMFMAGYMFGAVCFTSLSDKFGRKPVFLFSNWAMVVIGVITAFLPDYTAFVFFRFLAGTLTQVGRLCWVNWRVFNLMLRKTSLSVIG